MPSLKYSFNGYRNITSMLYWKERGELYLGLSSGIIAVMNKYASIDFPFCNLP